jgi:hypothetical protein
MALHQAADGRPAAADGLPADLAEENRRLRALQHLVALASQTIATQIDTRAEGEAVIAGTRRRALELFPGSGDTFDLIYEPRLRRIFRERFSPFEDGGADR